METKKKIYRNARIVTISILLLAILVLLLRVTYSWFYVERSLVTAASVISPYTLRLGAGSNESIEQLDMGNIDVTRGTSDSNGDKYTYYVFCVYGNPSVPYKIQLAHTTNIGFRYALYYANAPLDSDPNGDRAVYVDSNEKTWYFTKAKGSEVRAVDSAEYLVDTRYINNDGGGIADNNYVYVEPNGNGSYTNDDGIQKNAKALYMQSGLIHPTSEENRYGEFLHYYILKVIWDSTIKNDKETDIVYITVSAE